LKPKTGFESGSSPTATATVRVSENGAPIQTGHGLEETKRRITDAFEKIRQHPAQHPVQHSEPTPLQYTRDQEARFHQKAKRLSLAALESSHIMTSRGPVIEIAVPTESAEELYKAGGWSIDEAGKLT